MAELFDTSKQNIGQHITKILKERKLDGNSVVKYFFTTAADGKEYDVEFYALDMILAIGFRVRSKRGTQFCIWANRNLKAYMVKGFLMDDERLKNPDGRPDYFDELLERRFQNFNPGKFIHFLLIPQIVFTHLPVKLSLIAPFSA